VLRRLLLTFVLAFLPCFIFIIRPSMSAAESANYIYDEMGRLNMAVSQSGDAAVYKYDEVGNLISITREAVNPEPPLLTGITPQYAFIGNEISITVEGSNLITTTSVKADNPGIRIVHYSAGDNSVKVDTQFQSSAPLGPAVFTITTLFGSASISLDVLALSFTPATVTLAGGTTANITAQINGLTSDYNLVLTNQNPDIISVPSSLIVPASGGSTFEVTALANGAGVITAGNSGLQVYVTDPFVGSGTISSRPVSVFVDDLYQRAGVASRPVSALIGNYLNNGTMTSRPVSVQPGFAWGSVINSPLVSVKISQ
jgi:hypothetical protein